MLHILTFFVFPHTAELFPKLDSDVILSITEEDFFFLFHYLKQISKQNLEM